jgi:foldase protein PrsA
VPDPPDFTKCVAAKKDQPQPETQGKQSDSELKKQCRREYDTLKNEVMQFLIQAEWVQQEAEQQDVEVSQQAVTKSFEDQKKQAFPNDKAYDRFLETSGMTEEDILFRVKLDQLQQKLTQKVTEDAQKVSDQDIQEYYDKNKKRFAQPERRDLLVVLTKNEARADQARDALADGDSWRSVVKQYSIDEASKAQGGKLPAVAKGQQDKALDDAVFAAKRGEVEGPVKTQFGWYVFEVEKITPASQQSLEQSKDTIRNLLRSERQQKALDGFIKDFREEYKDQTDCAEDFRVAECKNAPKEDTDTASGGTPGGAQGQSQPAPQAPSPQE